MLTTLLALPTLVAFDIDAEGRLLVGYDGSGVRQLYEVEVDGSWRALTPEGERAVNAKYVPGTRQVVLERDTGGDEKGQLWILDLDGPLEFEPLVHDPSYVHHLAEAQAGQVLYTTNRRNNVDFDLVSRDLPSGEDRVLYGAGGYLLTSWPSPDGKWVVALKGGGPGNSVQALLINTATSELTELTGFNDPTHIFPVSWLADSSGLLLSGDFDRDRIAILKYDLATAAWTTVLADDSRDLHGWVSPDGERLLVTASEDGEVSLALHNLDGALLAPIDLPAGGCGAVLTEGRPALVLRRQPVAHHLQQPDRPLVPDPVLRRQR